MFIKNIKMGLFIMGFFSLGLFYQNCSQIQPGLNVTDIAQANPSGLVLDGNGNVVDALPARPGSSSEIEQRLPSSGNQTDSRSDGSKNVAGDEKSDADDQSEQEKEKEDSQVETSVDAGSSCSELAAGKYEKQAIDISNIDSAHKLVLLKGKNFVYSSGGNSTLSEIQIQESCGRLILCGVHVNKINTSRGRVDLIDSQVDQFGDHRGTIK